MTVTPPVGNRDFGMSQFFRQLREAGRPSLPYMCGIEIKAQGRI